MLLSACGGKSCSCVAPIKGGFPVAKRHENAIQVRATASAFDFIGKNGAALIPGLIGGNTLTIPPSCGGTAPICCATPNQVCQISFDLKDLTLTPTAPSSIHLSTDLVVKTVMDLPVTIPVIGACNIQIDTTAGTPQTINATADLTFAVDKTSDTTGLSASNAVVTVQPAAITISGGIGCDILQLPFVQPIVVSILQGVIGTELQTLIGGVACQACTTLDDCNAFATACTNGKCLESDGATCVPSLGLEGNVDVGSLLAGVAPTLKANMDFLAVTGGYAAADTGLSLGLLGGAQGDPHNDCVPVTMPPAVPTVTQSPTFYTDVLPDKAMPYHVGIGIHVSELNTIGWGAFDSGALCLQVGTKQVSLLSSSTLGIVMPSLQDLTHTANAPMYLQLKPAAAPVFTLGKGSFTTDANGQTIVADALLNIGLPGLSIDFYAFVDERFVRILTLTADVSLPLSLEVDPVAGTLSPVFGNLGTAFQNVRVTNSDLLGESPQQLAMAFPTLLGVAVGQIVGNLKNIALPAIAGLQISPIAITSTDPNAQGIAQFFAIFANLAIPATTPLIQPKALATTTTTATLTKVELPPTREFAVTDRGTTQPTAHVAVAGNGAGPFEFAWSLDDGPWSPFTATAELVVQHPTLWLQGRHTLDVRGRIVGAPSSLGAPTRLPLIIDTIAPTGRIDVAGNELVVADAADNVSPVDALQLRYAVSGGAFGEWQTTTRATLPAGTDTTQLHVQLRDEAGNVTNLSAQDSGQASASGCSIGGHGGDASLLALALVVAALLLRRRRAAVSAAVVLGLVTGCSHKDGLTKGDFANPQDEIGRFSDVVVDGSGTIHASAYDDNYGDLVYTTILPSAISGTPSWQVIDGVDLTQPPEMKGGYRFGITDAGDDVGQYTSLALTSSGKPLIAYYDATNKALKIAIGPHPFKTYAIDTATGAEDVGRYAAISLDKHDVPSIAYVATNIASGDGFTSELRVATAKSSSPSSASDWTQTVADTTPITCAGLCADGSACITPAMVNGMANTDASLSTCIQVVAGACPTACSSTQACINAACTTFNAPVTAPDLVEGTGLFVNARRDSGDNLVLIYYDKEAGSLKTANKSSGTWSSSFLDGPVAGVDVGQFASAALASDDTLHVSYVDATNGTLLYKQVPKGGTPPATAEIVDDGVRSDGTQHAVGAGVNLILDSSASPRVVYQDQTLSDLEKATLSGSSWTRSDLNTGGAGYGFYARQILAGGKLYMVDFVYDRDNGSESPLGTLQFSVSAP